MIYFDNAATMPMATGTAKLLVRLCEEGTYNPSSRHLGGRSAQIRLNNAREQIAGFFGASAEGLHFCSGATEAANILLQGYAQQLLRENSARNEIVVSGIEHPAVYATAHSLKRLGFVIKVLEVDRNGQVKIESLKNSLSPKTALVSIMSVNNETGTVQPIHDFAQIVKSNSRHSLFMTDAVQAFGKLDLRFDPASVDAVLISGHKIGALRGFSAFYLNPEFKIKPVFFGGAQEGGYRPGTSDDVGAHILACRAKSKIDSLKPNFAYLQDLNYYLLESLQKNELYAKRNVDANLASPYVTSLCLRDFSAHQLTDELSDHSICVSTGSACSSQNIKPSRVLTALGLSKSEINSTIRISFSEQNSRSEIDEFVAVIRMLRTQRARAS